MEDNNSTRGFLPTTGKAEEEQRRQQRKEENDRIFGGDDDDDDSERRPSREDLLEQNKLLLSIQIKLKTVTDQKEKLAWENELLSRKVRQEPRVEPIPALAGAVGCAPDLAAGFESGSGLLRRASCVLISLVNIAKVVLDLLVSVRALLGDSSDDDVTGGSRSFALLLFFTTVAARFLGGVFGAFYQRMDKSNRCVTYLLVEMTIWCTEDFVALAYILTKQQAGHTLLDTANICLSVVRYVGYSVCTLYNYTHRDIEKSLPCIASYPLFFFYSTLIPFFTGWIRNRLVWSITYPIVLVVQVSVVCLWGRYLRETPREPPPGEPAPESDDGSL